MFYSNFSTTLPTFFAAFLATHFLLFLPYLPHFPRSPLNSFLSFSIHLPTPHSNSYPFFTCDPSGFIALVEEDFEWVTTNLVSNVTYRNYLIIPAFFLYPLLPSFLPSFFSALLTYLGTPSFLRSCAFSPYLTSL